MKSSTCALLIALLLAIVLLGSALARPASDFNLWWHVVASGGGNSVSSNYAASGTIGQPAVGASSGGDYRLEDTGM